jgi:two-component system OmpR family response regulator
METILIVEDDEDIRDILKTYLLVEKYRVLEAGTLAEMREILTDTTVDVMLLDVMLPDGEAFDDLPHIRSKNKEVGIIIVSAKKTDRDRIYGLESGADDYIPKPFNAREVVARVRALLKRIRKDEEILTFGSLALFPSNYSVICAGITIELTAKEFEILLLLAKQPNKIFTRDEIISHIWFDDELITDRVVDVHISAIRNKIGKNRIKTVRSVGYRFNKDADLLEPED